MSSGRWWLPPRGGGSSRFDHRFVHPWSISPPHIIKLIHSTKQQLLPMVLLGLGKLPTDNSRGGVKCNVPMSELLTYICRVLSFTHNSTVINPLIFYSPGLIIPHYCPLDIIAVLILTDCPSRATCLPDHVATLLQHTMGHVCNYILWAQIFYPLKI